MWLCANSYSYLQRDKNFLPDYIVKKQTSSEFLFIKPSKKKTRTNSHLSLQSHRKIIFFKSFHTQLQRHIKIIILISYMHIGGCFEAHGSTKAPMYLFTITMNKNWFSKDSIHIDAIRDKTELYRQRCKPGCIVHPLYEEKTFHVRGHKWIIYPSICCLYWAHIELWRLQLNQKKVWQVSQSNPAKI